MPRIVTDTETFTVQVIQHGFATILNPNIPTMVEANTPFDIIYECRNDGAVADTLYGLLYQNDVAITDSEWSEAIQPNETKQKTYHHQGITASITIKIEVGHE